MYRSVSFSDKKFDKEKGLTLHDNHMKQLNIKKMTQKFEKDDEKPANEQIRKTVFNLDQQRIYIHYHYANGQIFSDPNEYNRDELRGDNQLDVNEDKNEVDGKK